MWWKRADFFVWIFQYIYKYTVLVIYLNIEKKSNRKKRIQQVLKFLKMPFCCYTVGTTPEQHRYPLPIEQYASQTHTISFYTHTFSGVLGFPFSGWSTAHLTVFIYFLVLLYIDLLYIIYIRGLMFKLCIIIYIFHLLATK